MRLILVLMWLVAFSTLMMGCSSQEAEKAPPDEGAPGETATQEAAMIQKASKPQYEGSAVVAGDYDTICVAVAASGNADPEAAAREAAAEAIKACGGQAKGLVVYEDTADTKAVVKGLDAVVDGLPYIGCHAEGQATDKTYKKGVTVMAIGGKGVKVAAAAAPLMDKREQSAEAVCTEMKKTLDQARVVFVYSEPTLSFGAGQDVTTVEHFLQGMKQHYGQAMMFGGNCKPNEAQPDANQFSNGKTYKDYVVAMAVDGPFTVVGDHNTEFQPIGEPLAVTKGEWDAETGKWWIVELDGRPATTVYKEIAGMESDSEFTFDDQHAIGVIVTPERLFLRMVLKLRDDGAFMTISQVPEGQKIHILEFPGKAEAIYASNQRGLKNMISRAGSGKPLAVLASDCCARGFRLEKWTDNTGDEVVTAVKPVISPLGVPFFGFYAYGEIGPIRGPFKGLDYMYQQHTFVSMMLMEE